MKTVNKFYAWHSRFAPELGNRPLPRTKNLELSEVLERYFSEVPSPAQEQRELCEYAIRTFIRGIPVDPELWNRHSNVEHHS